MPKLLRTASIACISVLLTQEVCATSPEDLEHEFLFAHMFPETSLSGEIATDFAAQLAAQAGVRVRVVGGGQIGDERANIRQLVSGEIAFAMTGDLFIGTMLPQLQAMNLPFLTDSYVDAYTLHHYVMVEEVKEALEQFGLIPLSTHCIGQRFLTTNRPVAVLSDLQGLKLRLPPDPVWTQAWTALGAEVSNIPFTRLRDALAAGEVEAQENPLSLIRSAEIHEVQQYLIFSRHYIQYQYIMASDSVLKTFDTLTLSTINRIAADVSSAGCAKAMQQQQSDWEWLTSEGGMTHLSFDDSGIREIILPLVDALATPQSERLREYIQGQ